MDKNERYGLFINWKLYKEFPATIEGFQEALKLSRSIPIDEDGEHEIRVFPDDEDVENAL